MRVGPAHGGYVERVGRLQKREGELLVGDGDDVGAQPEAVRDGECDLREPVAGAVEEIGVRVGLLVRDDGGEGVLDSAVGGGGEGGEDVADSLLGLLVRLLLQPLGELAGERYVLLWDGGPVVAQAEPGLEPPGRLGVGTGADVLGREDDVGFDENRRLGVNEVGPLGVEAELAVPNAPGLRRVGTEDRSELDEAVASRDGVPSEVTVLGNEDPLIVVVRLRDRLAVYKAYTGQRERDA